MHEVLATDIVLPAKSVEVTRAKVVNENHTEILKSELSITVFIEPAKIGIKGIYNAQVCLECIGAVSQQRGN